MSTTSLTVQPTRTVLPPDRLAALGLVGGAIALTVGRLVTLPGGTPAQRLAQAEGQTLRVTLELVLVIFGLAALVGGFLAVAGRLREGGPRLAGAGALLCLASLGLIVQVGLEAVYVAAVGGPRGVMESFVTNLDSSIALNVVTAIATVGYFFGPFLISLTARRAGLVSRWLPWGMLVSLPLQSVGETLRGPFFANVADAVLQLVLVVMVVFLARGTLLLSTPQAVQSRRAGGQQPVAVDASAPTARARG